MTLFNKISHKQKSALDLKTSRKLISLEVSARDRGLEFDLTFNNVQSLLLEDKCYFTGMTLTDEEGKYNQRSIDRLDNNKGYVNGNVVVCARGFNVKKGNLTPHEIKLLYDKIKHL